jgi:hypothetical protein
MTDQIRRPTGDDSESGVWSPEPTTPTTKWDKVDEASADEDSTYLENNKDEGNMLFSFTAFDLPTGAEISKLAISYRHRATAAQANHISSALTVNGTVYDTVDSGVNPENGVWNTTTYDYTVNPDTSLAWTEADIEGTSSNPLTAFGINSTDSNPLVQCTQVFATVTYTVPVIELLAGTSDGLSTAGPIPAMEATRELAGTSAGVCTVTNIPALKAIRELIGTSDGLSAAGPIPAMTAIRELLGTSDGIAIVSDIPAIKVSYDLTLDPSDGLSTAIASLVFVKLLAGQSDGVAVVSDIPVMQAIRELIGTSDGLSTAV